jgi:hypothetical protein
MAMETIRKWRAGRHDRRQRAGVEWAAFAEALEDARRQGERSAAPGVRYRPRRSPGEGALSRLPAARGPVEAPAGDRRTA